MDLYKTVLNVTLSGLYCLEGYFPAGLTEEVEKVLSMRGTFSIQFLKCWMLLREINYKHLASKGVTV